LGAAVAVGSRRIWPVAPHEPARARRVPTRTDGADPDGTGLHIVVNPAAGSALGSDPVEELRQALPAAKLTEIGDSAELVPALQRAADDARAIGVLGGDGSISAAAGVALDAGLPLMIVPTGTLNHFARDLGVHSVDDAIEAVRAQQAVAVDVAAIDGNVFVNTASFGNYATLVDARERLEGRVGKWPALVVALVRVLRRGEPADVELDGRRRRLWMIFVGNCEYHPSGFAPTWRERLDDGRFDVRVVDGQAPYARARLVLAVLTGTLARCAVYERRLTESLRVRSLGGPLRLARDGETFDGCEQFEIRKLPERLRVYARADS
jgi:undecaprenyl-diphosphatase